MTRLVFNGHRGVELVADAFGDPDHPAVLLLPATTQAKEMWHGAGEALATAGRYAVCVDLRGHGSSGHAADGSYTIEDYAADIREVVAQLPSRPTIVGVGPSGLAALLAISESAAPLATALVLVGVTLWVDPGVVDRIKKAVARRTETFPDAESALAAVAAVHPFEPSPTAGAKLLTAFEQGTDGVYRWRCDHRVLAGFNLIKELPRLEIACGKINLPTLLIRGELNESVSADFTRRLQGLISGSDIVEIDGAGHYVVTDREDTFNAALLEFLEQKAPRAPIQYRGGSDSRNFRDALGCFGTGVTVVTTMDAQGEPVGLTANSFTSVSLDPPLILFCLAKSSANLETFKQAKGFAVNVLHIGQQLTSARFARRDAPRFDGTPWEQIDNGSPLLNGSVVSFDCRSHAVHEGGDHLIFVGEVVYARFEPHRDPLLYFRGKYRRLHFV